MSNQNNNDNLENLLRAASKHLGANPEDLKKSAQSGNLSETLKNLSPSDLKKFEQVLSDKNAAEKLLSTPQAKELLKKFLGGN